MAEEKKKLQKGPDLDRFLEGGKRRFTTYARGAGSADAQEKGGAE